MALDGAKPEDRANKRSSSVSRLPVKNAFFTYQSHSSQNSPKRFPFDRSSLRYIVRTMDVVFGLLTVLCAAFLLGVDLMQASTRIALPYFAAPLCAFLGMRVSGAYRFNFGENAIAHLAGAVWGASIGLIACVLVTFLFEFGAPPPPFIQVCGILLLAFTGLHAHYISFVRMLTRAGALSDNAVIVGATPTAYDLIKRNQDQRELNILGVFDDRGDRAPASIAGVPVLGEIKDLMNWDKLPTVDRIIVTVSSTAQGRVRDLVDRLRHLPQEVILILDLEGFAPEQTSVANIVDAPAAYVSGAPKDARRAALKRLQDIVVASMMLIAFSPFMALIALMIKLDSPGKIFFRQKRHGFNNQIIRVWKFRTMKPDEDAEEGRKVVQTVHDDERVTRVGRFLRRTSLDELPQLFNILLGDMSVVGPRPHALGMTAEEVEVHRIVGDYAHRHRMKPGLTGWAQINGSRGPVHSAELLRERVRLDMEYLKRASFWFDMYVILMTAPCLLGDTRNTR